MRIVKFRVFLALLWIFSGFVELAAASGSYTGRPPRPPKSEERVLYAQGKGIFNGQVELKKGEPKGEYLAELERLQAELPRTVKLKVKLPELADSLTEEQFESLKHYLSVRYKIR